MATHQPCAPRTIQDRDTEFFEPPSVVGERTHINSGWMHNPSEMDWIIKPS